MTPPSARKLKEGKSGEDLFFELALEDLTRAADLFPPDPRPDLTAWTAGCRWKSRPCWLTTRKPPSPRPRICTPARDAPTSSSRFRAPRKACLPSRRRSLPVCRSTSRSCSPASSTWRLPRRSCAASSGASMPGSSPTSAPWPRCSSAAGTSRSMGKVPAALNDQLGIAIAKRTYKAYRALLNSPRWLRAYNAGARPQRLLWASTGTKDPKASDILYIKALAAPFTVNTMPEGTLKAFADHGEIGAMLPADGGDCEAGAGAVRRGRHRCRCPGGPAAGRRSQVVRQVLERLDGGDRVQIGPAPMNAAPGQCTNAG